MKQGGPASLLHQAQQQTSNLDGISGKKHAPISTNMGNKGPKEEIIDINSCIFKMNQANEKMTPGFQMKSETYIPKLEATKWIKKIEDEAKQRIEQYRLFTVQLKDKYRAYEKEAEDYYGQLLNDYRQVAKVQLQEQEKMMEQLKKQQRNQQVTIDLLNAQLTDAQEQIRIDDEERKAKQLNRCNQEIMAVEVEEAIVPEEEPKVYVREYEMVKKEKAQNKEMIQIWYEQFHRENGRLPFGKDYDAIKGLVQERQRLQLQITQMKAQLIKQNELPEEKIDEKFKLPPKPQIVEIPVQGPQTMMSQSDSSSIIQKDNQMLPSIVNQKYVKPIEITDAKESAKQSPKKLKLKKKVTKKNQDGSPGLPSQPSVDDSAVQALKAQNARLEDDVNRLISDIEKHEAQNQELLGQIRILEKLMAQNASENDIIDALQKQLDNKQTLLQERDGEITNLIEREKLVKVEKQEVIDELEAVRVQVGVLSNSLQNVTQELRAQEEINERQKEEIRSMLQKNFYDQTSNGTQQSFFNAQTVYGGGLGANNEKALKSLRDEIERMNDENKELREQIEFLRKFKEATGNEIVIGKQETSKKLVKRPPSEKKIQTLIIDEHDENPSTSQLKQSEPKLHDEMTLQDMPLSPNQSVQQLEQNPVPKILSQNIQSAPQPFPQIDHAQQKEIEDLKSLSAKQREEIEYLQNKLDNLKQVQKEQQNQSFISSDEKTQQQIHLFQQKLQAKKEKINGLKQTKQALEQEIVQTKQRSKEELQLLQTQYSQEITKLQQEISQLKSELQLKQQSENSEVQSLQSRYIQEVEKVKSLTDQVSEKESLLEQTKMKYDALILSKDAEISDLKNEQERNMSAGQQTQQQLRQECDELTAKLSQKEALLQQKLDEIEVIKLQMEKSEKSRETMQDKISDLEIDIEQRQKVNMELNKKIEQLLQTQAQLETIAGDAQRLKEENKDLGKELNVTQKELGSLQVKYKEEQLKRKQLHNALEDMKGKIRVYCRVRPLSNSELEREESKNMAIKCIDEFQLIINTKQGQKPYEFDSVFGPSSTQDQVFEETKRLIQSAIDGFNVCIFAYGQTGSGKTHTIQGNDANPGITPRSIDELFTIVESMNNYDVRLSCYMVELYKDELRDLLANKGVKVPLEIKESAAIGQVEIIGAQKPEIKSIAEANKIFSYGLTHRMTRATKMNDSSSRSHLIFAIMIESYNRQTKVRTNGKLSFVDLAGSENQKKTGTDKEGADEGRAINQSLSALGNVISALAKGQAHIPYRDHPLTKLMKDSLGGTAKTLMFVNVSPSAYNEAESKNSLEYATRVKKIKNKVVKNVETKAASNLKTTLVQLESILDKYKEVILKSNMSGEIAELEKQLQLIQGFNQQSQTSLAGGTSKNTLNDVDEEDADGQNDDEPDDA